MIEQVLEARQSTYGEFDDNARISQMLKLAMKSSDGWERLNVSQTEALEMIAHKIARILNGDPNYADNWIDISGYSTLVAREIAQK